MLVQLKLQASIRSQTTSESSLARAASLDTKIQDSELSLPKSASAVQRHEDTDNAHIAPLTKDVAIQTRQEDEGRVPLLRTHT